MGKIKPKKATPVIDSRHLKVLSAKRSELRDSIVFICLDEEKYGHIDKAGLNEIAKHVNKLEPDGIYFPIVKSLDISFYDRAEFKNRDVLITIEHQDPNTVDVAEFEEQFKRAFQDAKKITFVHKKAKIEKK